MIAANKLIHGDAIEVLKTLPDKSVDLILTDPPYGTTANTWDRVVDFNLMWRGFERVVAARRNMVLFGAGLFAFKLALSNEQLFRYEMIWRKSKCGSPLTAKYMPLKKHESVLVFGEGGSLYNPQMKEGKPYKRKWTPHKMNNMKFGIRGVEKDNAGTRHPDTVLEFKQQWRRQDQCHPTQKPVALFEYLIRTYSNEGDTILDCFAGSGTTAIACINTNRKYILVEKEEKYFNMMKARIEKHEQQLSLLAA